MVLPLVHQVQILQHGQSGSALEESAFSLTLPLSPYCSPSEAEFPVDGSVLSGLGIFALAISAAWKAHCLHLLSLFPFSSHLHTSDPSDVSSLSSSEGLSKGYLSSLLRLYQYCTPYSTVSPLTCSKNSPYDNCRYLFHVHLILCWSELNVP